MTYRGETISQFSGAAGADIKQLGYDMEFFEGRMENHGNGMEFCCYSSVRTQVYMCADLALVKDIAGYRSSG